MMIFISHSTCDKPFARRLKQELNDRRLTAWLDEAEIRVGQSIPNAIGQAIDNADVFCILLSTGSTASPWVGRELNAFMPKWIAGNGTLLPCRLDACTLPALIRDIKYADFYQSFEAGFTELIRAVSLREEVALHADLEAARAILLNELSSSQISRFVHWFTRGDHYLIPDEGSDPGAAVFAVLKRVEAVRLVTNRADYLAWALTDKGTRLLTLMKPDADQGLLQKWDRPIPTWPGTS
jgi:hypothetical protein